MQLINLIRAHVLGHSTAAMALKEWDLARIISLNKIEALQQKQIDLLLKANRISEKIERGGLFTFYYRYQLDRLNKESQQVSDKIITYQMRAIRAQSYIEPGVEHEDLDVSVPYRSALDPKLMGFDYTNTPQCLAQAFSILHKPPILTHRQTLHLTSDMASELIHRFDDLAQSRYLLIKTAENPEISEEDRRCADEIAESIQSSMHFHLLSMQDLAENIGTLMSHYDLQQNCQRESDLAKNIRVSLEQLLDLYGQEDEDYLGQIEHQLQESVKTSVEHPVIASSINVLLDSEKDIIRKIIYTLDQVEHR